MITSKYALLVLLNIVLWSSINVVNCVNNFTSDCFHEKSKTAGVCIIIQNCQQAQKDFNSGIPTQGCGLKNGIPNVCCPKYLGERKLITPVGKPNLAEIKCEEYSKRFNFGGLSSLIEFGIRINEGKNAYIGEFPHFAALGTGILPDVEWKCGGTLVSEKFVLTAAHCLRSNSPITVVQLGDIRLNSNLSKSYDVKQIYKYQDYIGINSYNDIGLIELNTSVEFTDYIRPACLPKVSISDLIPKSIVSGFGGRFEGSKLSEVLQKAELELFSIEECAPLFQQQSRLLPNGIIEATQLCYGSKTSGQDACPGDSGGPLQYRNYNSILYRIIGVVSTGKSCGSVGVPGIYTRLSFYVPWIESIVWGQETPEMRDLITVVHPPSSIAERKCRDYAEKTKFSSKSRNKRVVGGQRATEGEFPHFAKLGNAIDTNITWICGGSLISETFILTSATCIAKLESNTSRAELGSIMRDQSESKIYRIKRTYVHPKFKNQKINNIGLVELVEPVQFTQNIKPACIPNNDKHFRENPPERLSVCGFGWTSDYALRPSKVLNKVDVHYFTFEECRNIYNEILTNFNFENYFLCYGNINESKNACYGDGGSPLQFYENDFKLHRIIGIIGFGKGKICSQPGDPFVYTRVSHYVPWIESIVWANEQ